MPMPKDYDKYYQILRLVPGSDLAEIQQAHKYWAPLYHPDNFSPGPLQERALEEMKKLNDARDQLRNWWSSNDGPPPSKSAPPPPPPQQEKQKQTDPEPKQKGPEPQRGSAPPPPPPPKPEPEPQRHYRAPKPFGPPPLVKSWNHHLYDVMNSSRSDAAALGLALWAIIAIGPFFATFWLSQFVLGGIIQIGEIAQPISAALGIAMSIPFWLMVKADREIYKIEVSPYLQPSGMSASAAMEKITALIDGKIFAGKKWQLAGTDLVAEDNILAKDWTMSFQDGDRKYALMLNTRVMQTERPNQSVISYWFSIDAAVDWRVPVSGVLKATDDSLWRGLK